MPEFYKKKAYKKYLYSPVTLLLLFIILLVLLKALWGVYKKEELSAEYLLRQQNEYNKLQARQKDLAQAVEYLKTDKGIEAEIRSKFRVVKEGESVAVIVDNDASTTKTILPAPKPGFWKSLLNRFGL